MKRKRLFLVPMAVVFLFFGSFTVSAEEDVDFYTKQYEESGAGELGEALPDETKQFFDEYGLYPSDSGWVNSYSAQSVFSHIAELAKGSFKKPLKVALSLTAVLLVSAAFGAYSPKGAASVAKYVAVIGSAAAITAPAIQTASAAVDVLKGVSSFMLAFVPIFAVIVTSSGAVATAASMSALLLGASQAVAYISGFAVAPLMGGYLAISLCGSVSPTVKISGIADTVKKLSCWLSALVSTVFVGILSIQTAVNSSADTLASKTAKFIIGSAVPLAGGAVSEALGTVISSLGLLKTSVGIWGAVACAAILLPLIFEITAWRIALSLVLCLADIFEVYEVKGLLAAIESVMAILCGLLFLVGAMFIISLAVVVSVGKAG